jgi:hypothetical protein
MFFFRAFPRVIPVKSMAFLQVLVWQEAAQPLLRSALQGERSTLIFFGQTGTGKTYTARGVLEAEVVKQHRDGYRWRDLIGRILVRLSGIIVGRILIILGGFHVGNRNDNTLS